MTPREASKSASPEGHQVQPVPFVKRNSAPPTKSQRREISSGIIIFRRTPEGPNFLVLFHGHEHWTFPRGKIEGEERSFAAALRETREETGLARADIRFVDYFKAYENWTFVKNGQKVFKTIIFYLAETTKKHVRIEPNFEGYCWFTYREALKIFGGVKNNENQKVLKQAYDFLIHRTHDVKKVRRSGTKRSPLGHGTMGRPSVAPASHMVSDKSTDARETPLPYRGTSEPTSNESAGK